MRFNFRFMLSLFTTLILQTALTAQADNQSEALTRTVGATEVTTTLSEDQYRQVPYQYEYDVQIPYEDTEHYTVDVPYDETESYTEYEDYYDNEYICRTVTDQQRQCHYDNICRTLQEPDGSTRQECTNQEVCQYVPVSRQECQNESVRRSRPVTRQRTVTRYRQESRTRTVTRYRTESRCCKTGYKPEYTHTEYLPVIVRFPKEAVLLEGETETVIVKMVSKKAASIQYKNTVYGYKITSEQLVGKTYEITLAMMPKYEAKDLGEKTLSEMKFSLLAKDLSVSFTDKGLRAHVETKYVLEVLEKTTGAVIEKFEMVSDGSQKVKKHLEKLTDLDKDYIARLAVHREGINLAGIVDFTKQVEGSKLMPIPSDDKMESGLSKIYLSGSGVDSEIFFADNSALNPAIATEYNFVLSIEKAGKKYPVTALSFSAQSLNLQNNQVVLGLAEDFSLSETEAAAILQSGAKIWVDLEVVRTTGKRSVKKIKRALQTRIL